MRLDIAFDGARHEIANALARGYPCPHVPAIPDDDEDLFRLPNACILNTFAEMDGKANFATVRLGWNRGGLAVEVEVRGKEQLPAGVDLVVVPRGPGLSFAEARSALPKLAQAVARRLGLRPARAAP